MRGKRWLIGLGIVLVVVVGAKFLLFDTAASPEGQFTIDLDALHQKAIEAGPLPTRIDVEHVADFKFPRTFAVAGEGFQMHAMTLLSHRVVWPDRSLIIDTAMSPEDVMMMPGAKPDEAGYKRLEAAMAKADTIIFTHEHVDHMGGLARAPNYDAVAAKTLITREQYDGPRLERDKFAPGALEKLKPLSYNGLYAVAPGVVLQKAPGHSTGTQLIYVELENGQRYLFVGDIAWTADNVTEQRGRPYMFTLMAKEDRPAVAAQVAALGKLPKDVHLVYAHDPVVYKRDLQAGLFHDGFTD